MLPITSGWGPHVIPAVAGRRHVGLLVNTPALPADRGSVGLANRPDLQAKVEM